LAREVFEPGQGARIGVGRAFAAAGVVIPACSLPLLPVLVASGVANGFGLPPGVAASGGVAALLLGGGKLAAMAAGLIGGAGGAFHETEPAATD